MKETSIFLDNFHFIVWELLHFLFYYALEKLLIKVNPIWPVGLIPNQLKLHKNNWADTGKIRQAEKAIIKERKNKRISIESVIRAFII